MNEYFCRSSIILVLIVAVLFVPYQTFARDRSLGTDGGYNACISNECYRYNIPLHEAVRGANFEEVKKLIASGEDMNESDFNGSTALSLAILSSQTRIADHLIQQGANPNSSKTLIAELIKKNDIKAIERLLDIGANVDGPPGTPTTREIPLLAAIEYHNIAISLMLIKRGANVNIEPKRDSKDYHNALALAAYDPNLTSVIKALLDAGADPNRQVMGFTPLHCAAGVNNIEAVKLLIQKGANINTVDSEGFTPITKVFGSYRKDRKSELQIIKMLVSNGSDVNSKANSGNTLLHFAIRSGTKESVQYLIMSKANPNVKNNFGDTPMHFATESGNVFLTELLLKAGADPRIKNMDGKDSIYIALNTPFRDVTIVDSFNKLFIRYKIIE